MLSKKKNIDLTPRQKDDYRRLVQLANRRIKAAERAYRKAGKDVLPYDVAGPYQIREQWTTKSTPISRSIKFTSEQEYKNMLRFLQTFDPKAKGYSRPSIKEYTSVQRDKTMQAVETSLGTEIPEDLEKKISKLSAPELSDFWKKFERHSARLGLKYSSDAVIVQTMNEFFPEDIKGISSKIGA